VRDNQGMPTDLAPPRDTATELTRPQRRLFFAAAGLLVAGDAIFWLMVAGVQSDAGAALLDGPVHDGLAAARNPWATSLLTAVTTVTAPLWMTLIGGFVAVAWALRKRELWRPAMLMGAMAATVVLSYVVKHQLVRARPSSADFVLGSGDALSFPSGHTFGAAVFLFVVAYLLASRARARAASVGLCGGLVACVGTALVAFSRLYLGYDWLTDVGASIGLAFAVTGAVILTDRLRGSTKHRVDLSA
jgi:membrane-associated phospholipid phosphatase